MENKKTLLLSVLGVLVLVVAVIGVSFAMYSFSGTGTRENSITTGTVSIGYDDTDSESGASTVLNLTNQYPMTDERGAAQTGEGTTLTFSISATMSGTMTINYDLAFDAVTPGATLTDDYVKFNITKDGEYLLGTSATAGVTVGSRRDSVGTLVTEGYLLDTGTFTATGSHKYVIKAWVADNYKLPTTDTSDNPNGIHSNETSSETFTFKVKVVAGQA